MILVNNRPQEFENNLTINRLLERNRYTYIGIVVKIDGKVIEEEDYDKTIVYDEDNVKIIHICHGG
jgi:thiamine biosynthesis protein ThiS